LKPYVKIEEKKIQISFVCSLFTSARRLLRIIHLAESERKEEEIDTTTKAAAAAATTTTT